MTNLYVQKFGGRRIVILLKENETEVLLQDVKDDLRYVMEKTSFKSHHELLEQPNYDSMIYDGPDLDRLLHDK